MLSTSDLAYLKRVIDNNDLVLFSGAGFSCDATNLKGNRLPLTPELCNIFWHYLDLGGTYDGSNLSKLFDLALADKKGHVALKELLENNLLVKEFPQWYEFLTNFYWYRIYTTNIDDLVESVFSKSLTEIKKIDPISATSQDFKERDQFLNSIQYIKLHGSLPGIPTHLTFSVSQYATRSAITHDVWYDHFVRDYATHPTLFVGTELNEPLFYQYISVREGKNSREGGTLDFSERRPKSFLIAPNIKKGDIEFYKNMNIIAVNAYAKDFFEWLSNEYRKVPSRIEIIKSKQPDFALIYSEFEDVLNKDQVLSLEEFYSCFEKVPDLVEKTDHPKNYLLGYSPSWQDIYNNLDAPRDISNEISEILELSFEEDKLSLFTLIGSAGSGKSTIMLRVAKTLKNRGYTVLYSNGRKLPSIGSLREALNILTNRVFIFIDNGEVSSPVIPSLIKEMLTVDRPPVVFIASQANLYDRLERKLTGRIRPTLLKVPNLSKNDITSVIKCLDRFGLLGKLQGKNLKDQIFEFEIRAKSQILVAMKEATRGQGFAQIIKEEFDNITPDNSRILLLCVALASAENLSLTKEQYVSCSNATDYETLGYLDRNLRDVVVPDPIKHNFLTARHSLIAREIIEKAASKNELKEAYIRLLQTLSHDFSVNVQRKLPSFRLYQLIVSHKKIYERFEYQIKFAREIFESIKPLLKKDWHYWLQYGSLELEYGELEFAENYLDQAFELNPSHDFVIHAKAHLILKKAINSINIVESLKLREEGEKILKEQIEKETLNDPYPYHIMCSQLLLWTKIWVTKVDQKKKELEKIKGYILEGVDQYPFDEKLLTLKEEIIKEYLSIVI